MTVRELPAGETGLAARARRELRPHFPDPEGVAERIDALQRPQGYRVVASFASEAGSGAVAAAGFRVLEMLARGRVLYVDDLVTVPERRGEGHADALFAWLLDEAHGSGCDELQLDSGVGPERLAAHRFYFRHGMRIVSYHFALETPARPPAGSR